MRAPGRKSSNFSASRRWDNNPPSVRSFDAPALHSTVGLAGKKQKNNDGRPFARRGPVGSSHGARAPCRLRPVAAYASPHLRKKHQPPSWPVGLPLASGKVRPLLRTLPCIPRFPPNVLENRTMGILTCNPRAGYPGHKGIRFLHVLTRLPTKTLQPFGAFPLPESEPFPASQLLF